MYAVGYAGITFTATGKAVWALENGRTITTTLATAVKILQIRAESGTPPVPATGPVPPSVPATSVIVEGQ